MSIEKWVANASDDDIIDMFNHGDIRLASATWIALSPDLDRTIRIHQRGIGRRMADIMNSEEYKRYNAHEKMLPDDFKAEIVPTVEPPEVGTLVNGTLLCIDNEDAAFPTCLDNGKLRPIFNAELKQHYWVPTKEQARGVA